MPSKFAERYQAAKAKGLCPVCKRREPNNGKIQCTPCHQQRMLAQYSLPGMRQDRRKRRAARLTARAALAALEANQPLPEPIAPESLPDRIWSEPFRVYKRKKRFPYIRKRPYAPRGPQAGRILTPLQKRRWRVAEHRQRNLLYRLTPLCSATQHLPPHWGGRAAVR